jgi:hypothetical protein
MRIETIEAVLPAIFPDTRSIKLTQTASKSGALVKAALMLPSALLLIAPYIVVANAIPANGTGFEALTAHPALAAEILLGLALWTLGFGFLIARLGRSLATLRLITIDADTVHINDSGLIRERTSSIPLNDFSGIAHHVRTSLSGVRHELVLVHPDRTKSVLLSIAPRFAQAEIDRVCALLLCPEISSKSLYGLTVPAPRWTVPVQERDFANATG